MVNYVEARLILLASAIISQKSKDNPQDKTNKQKPQKPQPTNPPL